ncbi:MAG: hypothetical protein CVU88_03740 [Firmicutes bacterium HGW-Firmicutes-13]|nr:MAG: hypothetical protein CVU88_03740 [Firmicutes bacterium HGW-Firmicutes-13]
MCEYYFDEERALAYKINPITTSLVQNGDKDEQKAILVHTNIKVTNFKKEKIRRILSELYPADQYDFESAKKKFRDTLLFKVISGAKKISEKEYESIKEIVES